MARRIVVEIIPPPPGVWEELVAETRIHLEHILRCRRDPTFNCGLRGCVLCFPTLEARSNANQQ